MTDALIIGAGPAGLMAAETLADQGHSVMVVEAKPSVGRKLLMAGKSGLNITKAEDINDFIRHYSAPWLEPILREFGPQELWHWCHELGQELFIGSSGRVFPRAMKASPLLRAWLMRLGRQGVTIRTGWRWQGFAPEGLHFTTPTGPQYLNPRVTILALGGASWPKLGSDGAWAAWLADKVAITPFAPANMGITMAWSPYMQRHFGQPVKGACLSAGTYRQRGECVITQKGLEGGGIYALGPALRTSAPLMVDFFPDLSLEQLNQRLQKQRAQDSLPNRLRKLGLGAGAIALVQECARPLPADPAPLLKALPVRHQGPRPIAEAISSAGGIAAGSFDDHLALPALPGFFACGEMLDWEAPTGGYLLTACWATGRRAGKQAGAWLTALRGL